MFRDIGDKLGVIRGEIGLAKCLVQMKQMKEAMNYYQLAVKASHAAGNKVSVSHTVFRNWKQICTVYDMKLCQDKLNDFDFL